MTILRDLPLQSLGPRINDSSMTSIPSVLAAHCGLVAQTAFYSARCFPVLICSRVDDQPFLGLDKFLSSFQIDRFMTPVLNDNCIN